MDDNNENIETVRRRLHNANKTKKSISSQNNSLNDEKYHAKHYVKHNVNHNATNDIKHPTHGKHLIAAPKFKKIDGMVGKIKIFDQELSDRYDKRSRVIVKSKLGPAVRNNPDKYAEDMIVVTKRIPYGYIELQVYGKWTEDKFPYDSPFIYERKLKFCETTLFICFNASYDKLVMFSRTSVHPKRYRVKKYSREFIHYVPWSKAITLDTDKLSIEYIRQYCGLFDDESEDEYCMDLDHAPHNQIKNTQENKKQNTSDYAEHCTGTELDSVSIESLCNDSLSSAESDDG